MKKVILIIMVLLATQSLSFSMDVPPQTSTIEVIPEVEFLKSYGSAGSADGQFFLPSDVYVTTVGNLTTRLNNIFITDTGNNRIERLDKDGDFVYQFGKFGAEGGQFNSPSGIVVDFNYYIYVVDKENSRIQQFDIYGNYVNSFGSFGKEDGEFEDPYGIAMDSIGRIYIADSGNDRIQKFESRGSFIESFGSFGYGDGFFDGPLDVAIDKASNIYVADTGNDRVQVLDEFGKPILIIDQYLKSPSAVSVDDYYIYVSSSGDDKVVIFDKQGNFVLSFGGTGTDPGEFNNPQGISVSENYVFYVVDSGNQRIQKFKLIL
ncbi:MAG: 6-bladed beta-propeller [Candidatus Margulisbacteria bacterium]|nr:6-bladed beta-propeller [Candidatus Margulisiibacteriota bacterium]MBU1021813.1 6-bladed beta-propeller [Candidatus Margulisiibacteriota bacterium]MBU1729613.1 6-bladed beta-propeller [Candidatus Margulisiibacteriota bacterium]